MDAARGIHSGLVLGGMMLLVVAAVRLWADVRRLDRAGIHRGRPGCPGCLYPIGDWSSSHCPECGADVGRIGVRIRPTTSHALVRLGAAFLITPVVLALMLLAAGWLLETRIEGEEFELWAVSPAHRVDLIVARERSRVPPVDRRRVDVRVWPTLQGDGRPGLSANFVRPYRPPGAGDWTSILVRGGGVDPVHPELPSVAAHLADVVEAALDGGMAAARQASDATPYRLYPSRSSSRSRSLTGSTRLVVLLSASLASFGLAVAAARRVASLVPDGRRSAVAEEWAAPPSVSPPRSA